MSIVALLSVAIGGAVGAGCRFLVTGWIQGCVSSRFPWGTWIVNLSGSLAIGIAFGFIDSASAASFANYLFVAGFLGSYTTFSTFSYENLMLLQRGSYQGLLINWMSQTGLGIAAVTLGLLLTGAL